MRSPKTQGKTFVHERRNAKTKNEVMTENEVENERLYTGMDAVGVNDSMQGYIEDRVQYVLLREGYIRAVDIN